MEVPLYESLEDFKDNYLADFSFQAEVSILKYLSMLKKRYNIYIEKCKSLHEKGDSSLFTLFDMIGELESLLPYQSSFILKNDLLEKFNPRGYTYDDFIINPKLLGECVDFGNIQEQEWEELYKKVRDLFMLKKTVSYKQALFTERMENFYQIIAFIDEQIELEKTLLLRFEDLTKKSNADKNIDLNSWELFNHIRYNDVGYLERSRYLKDITENYHPDLLKSLLKDLEFYLFIEKDQKEAEYDSDEIAQAIKEREAKDLPVPRLDIRPEHLLTDRQKEIRETHKKENGGKETICVDLESLLFPFEFFSLYEFQRSIIRKIKELSPQEKEPQVDIDISELKTSKTQSIALLHHTGILDFLRTQYPTLSDRQLAGFFEFLTKEPITVRNQSSQFTRDKKSVKYPIKNKKDIEDLDRLLVSFGMKERRIL